MESKDEHRIGTDATEPDGIGPDDQDAPHGERNLLALAGAAVIVVMIGMVMTVLLVVGRDRSHRDGSTSNAYATQLHLSKLAMSESSNLAGGKVTYLDGEVSNLGDRTVTGVTVRVEFRNAAHEVAQNETMALSLIRMREPYIDTEPVSASPLKPGERRDFRLIFDRVSADWDGAYPEVVVLGAATR